jgi:hypothetical protein
MGVPSALAALLIWGAYPGLVGGIGAESSISRGGCSPWLHSRSCAEVFPEARNSRVDLLGKSCMWDKERGSSEPSLLGPGSLHSRLPESRNQLDMLAFVGGFPLLQCPRFKKRACMSSKHEARSSSSRKHLSTLCDIRMADEGWPISKWAHPKFWKFEEKIPKTKTLMSAVTYRGVASLPSLDNVFSFGGAILVNAGQLATNAGELTRGGLQNLARMKDSVGPLVEDEMRKMTKRWVPLQLAGCLLIVPVNILLTTVLIPTQSGGRASGPEA